MSKPLKCPTNLDDLTVDDITDALLNARYDDLEEARTTAYLDNPNETLTTSASGLENMASESTTSISIGATARNGTFTIDRQTLVEIIRVLKPLDNSRLIIDPNQPPPLHHVRNTTAGATQTRRRQRGTALATVLRPPPPPEPEPAEPVAPVPRKRRKRTARNPGTATTLPKPRARGTGSILLIKGEYYTNYHGRYLGRFATEQQAEEAIQRHLQEKPKHADTK